jgi:hypothetical protein
MQASVMHMVKRSEKFLKQFGARKPKSLNRIAKRA